MRDETPADAVELFAERLWRGLFFFSTTNSAVGVLQINSDSEAGRSLDGKGK